MSVNSSGPSSRSGGVSSSMGERSVRQAVYAVHRGAVSHRPHAIQTGVAEKGGRLEKIKVSTAKDEGRLEKIEDMLGHLWNLLDDMQANQDADGPNSDQGRHNGAVSARGSMSD